MFGLQTLMFFLLLLHFCPKFDHLAGLKFDTGVGDRRRWIDISLLHQSMKDDLISSLLGFHAFTGCDSTSSFVRKGKLTPFRLLNNSKQFQSTFQGIGEQPSISQKIKEELENFTCS